MADINDIARVEYVLNNYDNITLLRDKKGEVLTSYEYKNKDNKPAPLLLIQKKINGTYYTAVKFVLVY